MTCTASITRQQSKSKQHNRWRQQWCHSKHPLCTAIALPGKRLSWRLATIPRASFTRPVCGSKASLQMWVCWPEATWSSRPVESMELIRALRVCRKWNRTNWLKFVNVLFFIVVFVFGLSWFAVAPAFVSEIDSCCCCCCCCCDSWFCCFASTVAAHLSFQRSWSHCSQTQRHQRSCWTFLGWTLGLDALLFLNLLAEAWQLFSWQCVFLDDWS